MSKNSLAIVLAFITILMSGCSTTQMPDAVVNSEQEDKSKESAKNDGYQRGFCDKFNQAKTSENESIVAYSACGCTYLGAPHNRDLAETESAVVAGEALARQLNSMYSITINKTIDSNDKSNDKHRQEEIKTHFGKNVDVVVKDMNLAGAVTIDSAIDNYGGANFHCSIVAISKESANVYWTKLHAKALKNIEEESFRSIIKQGIKKLVN